MSVVHNKEQDIFADRSIVSFQKDVSDILSSAQMGMWAVVLTANSSRLYADKVTAELIGIDEGCSPETSFALWSSLVDDSERGKTDEYFSKMLAGEKAEVTYLYHHPTRGKIFVRCGGMKDESYTGEGVCLRGCHQDVTQYVKQVNKMEETMRAISSMFLCAYEIDYDKHVMREVFSPESVSSAVGKVGYAFDMIYAMLKNVAATSDTLDAVKAFFDWDTIQQRLSRQNATSVDYCSKTLGWCHAMFVVVERKDDGTVKRLLYVNRVFDEEMQQAKKDQRIADTLMKDYVNVFIFNTKRLTVRSSRIGSDAMHHLQREETVEYPFDEFVKHFCNVRVFEDDKKSFMEAFNIDRLLNSIQQNGEYDYNFRIIDENGELHHFHCHNVMIDGSDEILSGYRNIDSIIESELQQRKLIEESLAVAENALKAKSVFLSNMSHDMRTPMNAIMGYASLAEAHIGETERVNGYLQKIQLASNHLLSLINDVLDMSRIESGKVIIDEKENSITSLLNNVSSLVQGDVQTKGQTYTLDIDVTQDKVMCDSLRLNQVLINCISNAIKYTLEGGQVAVSVCQQPCKLKGYANYEFSVKDTGVGISEDFLEHVFEPFEREQNSTISGVPGTGLGMAITKNLTNMMKGEISIKSKKGVGTEVYLWFQFRVV